jgi:isoleucyl-tRNA synthetase
VAYKARQPQALASAFGVALPEGVEVAVPIWTTTPWTLPASLAVTLGPELDYVLVEGPARFGMRTWLVLAEALAEKALARYGVTDFVVHGRAQGVELEGQRLQHPFYDREIPLILGEHVSAEDGTGAVHTAPGHGQEDFAVGLRYELMAPYTAAQINPVDGRGVYLPSTPPAGDTTLAGMHIWKANDAIVEVLRNTGALLAHFTLTHSYPHCWRHKTPVAFRATPQWFISMEQAGLRRDSLSAIAQVEWFPDWGEARIYAMVEGRPDWCISRQRTWGVPITLFAHKLTSEPHPRSVELMEQVALRVEQGGADAWYALDPRELLGDEAENYTKVTDILDVWFDSGVSHYCVLDQRPNLKRAAGDKVMYLEGSDQHRGWFHSALLTSVAMHAHAPYDEVLTHGFTVDAQGRKMSKSLGNTILPQKVSDTLGAEIIRLWVALTDYSGELSLSDEILKRVVESYRRIRNTLRFLLANTADFDPKKDALPVSEWVEIDRYALAMTREMAEACRADYARFEFHLVAQRLQIFCSEDLGAFWLDVLKDRLYTTGRDSKARRSAQSALYLVMQMVLRLMAPILSFTAEEAWQVVARSKDESIFFHTWTDLLPAQGDEAELAAKWKRIREIRGAVLKRIEEARAAGSLGSSLQAEVVVRVPAADLSLLRSLGDDLRFAFITSQARVEAGESLEVDVGVSANPKCERCWHYRADVGAVASHPTLCSRCVSNLEGPGEARRHA